MNNTLRVRPSHGVLMELDYIYELLSSNPKWLSDFPVTWAIEYYVNPGAQHLGKGDLIVCNEDMDHFLVVELKRTKKGRGKLLAQMYHYRDHFKWRNHGSQVDCAAYENGRVVHRQADNGLVGKDMFFTRPFREAWRKGMELQPPPKSLTFNRCRKQRETRAMEARKRVCFRPPVLLPCFRCHF